MRSKIFCQVAQKDRRIADVSQEIFVQHDGNRFKQGVRRDLCGIALSVFLSIILLFASCAHKDSVILSQKLHCFISISCEDAIGNVQLRAEKSEMIPTGGQILPQTEIAFDEGETVYDVLLRACKSHVCADNCRYCQDAGIQIESAFTPAYGTYYVEGIHHLYEKDCGSSSGWLFTVNGEMAEKGCSELTVQDGDQIEWTYVTDWNM